MGKLVHWFFDTLIVPIIMFLGSPIFALMALMDKPARPGVSFKQLYMEISGRGVEEDAGDK